MVVGLVLGERSNGIFFEPIWPAGVGNRDRQCSGDGIERHIDLGNPLLGHRVNSEETKQQTEADADDHRMVVYNFVT